MSEFDETHDAEVGEPTAVGAPVPALPEDAVELISDGEVPAGGDESTVAVEELPAGAETEVAEAPRWTRVDVHNEREAALAAAQVAVAAGECIVLPTDTVYGIGVSAFSADAVKRLLEAKRRGRDMPPPVLIAEPAMLGALATSLSAGATALAEAHWPGPLTLILTAHPSLHIDLGDTGGTIAVRVPDHDFTRELLRRTGPMAVSSANTSGNPASTSIDDAIEQLGNSVSVYLDAGPTRDDAPSTIVNFSGTSVGQVVRNGAIPLQTLRESAPDVVGVPVIEEEPGTRDDNESQDVLNDDLPNEGVSTEEIAPEWGPDDADADEATAYADAGSGRAAEPLDPDAEPTDLRPDTDPE